LHVEDATLSDQFQQTRTALGMVDLNSVMPIDLRTLALIRMTK